MNYYEKTIQEVNIFSGKIVNLKKLKVALPNGKTASREVVEHPGAVAILAKTNSGQFVLIKQFRKATERFLWEIPAGKLEPNEQPLECARRELAEETGYQAENWCSLGSFYTTPGFTNEIIHLFLAENLTQGSTNFDEDEYVEVYTKSWAEVENLISQGEICDAKTAIAFFQYKFKES